MDKKLIDQLKDGDEVSLALRGGAGWLHGRIAWLREDVLMLEVTPNTMRPETPYALVFLGEITALGVPRLLEATTPEPRQTGFMRG